MAASGIGHWMMAKDQKNAKGAIEAVG